MAFAKDAAKVAAAPLLVTEGLRAAAMAGQQPVEFYRMEREALGRTLWECESLLSAARPIPGRVK